MRKIFAVLIFAFLFSCKNELQKPDLELKLLSKELVCVENASNCRNSREWDFDEYDSLSRNILHYDLTNNSNKTFFIVLNQDKVWTLEENSSKASKSSKNLLTLNLYRDNNIISGEIPILGDQINAAQIPPVFTKFANFKKWAVEHRIYSDGSYVGLYHQDVFEHSFLLKPKEVKHFQSIVHLPFRTDEGDGLYRWDSEVDASVNKVGIALMNSSAFTQERMSIDQKEEMSKVRFTLMNDTIFSNKIPLRMVKMKKN